MGLMSWFKKSEPLAAQDPTDRRISKSSSKWISENFCDHCLATVGHDEIMTDICLSCGKTSANWPFGLNSSANTRAVRKIYDGSKWVYQYTYRDDEESQIHISDVRL